MAGFDDHFAILAALPARMEAAALEAVKAALEPVFEASQEQVPIGETGHLKETGRIDVEAAGTEIIGRISYGDAETVTATGVGYEIDVHEGNGPPGEYISPKFAKALAWTSGGASYVRARVHTSKPNKFLEGPVLEQAGDMGETLGRAYQAAFEGGA